MLKNYYKPTPTKWRKIGDSLLACSGIITGGGLFAFDNLLEVFSAHELKIIIGMTFIVGVVGKFITNLAKEENLKSQ